MARAGAHMAERLGLTLDSPVRARIGRPRDETRDAVILDAALHLVAEVGYERVSMEAIAQRAKASKATIYRRWPSKGALVAAAVRCRTRLEEHALPDCGTFRADLLATVSHMARSLGTQDLALLTGVFAGMRTDADLAEALRTGLLIEKVALTAPLFERARRRGEDLNPQASRLFHEVAPAVIMHRLLVVGLAVDEPFVEHVVDDMLLPILRSCPSSHTGDAP